MFREACRIRDIQLAKQLIDNSINRHYYIDENDIENNDDGHELQRGWFCCCKCRAEISTDALREILTIMIGKKTIYTLAEYWVYEAYCFNLLEVLDHATNKVSLSLVNVDWNSCWLFACNNGNKEMVCRAIDRIKQNQLLIGLYAACNKKHIDIVIFVSNVCKIRQIPIPAEIYKKYVITLLDEYIKKQSALFDIKSISLVSEYMESINLY